MEKSENTHYLEQCFYHVLVVRFLGNATMERRDPAEGWGVSRKVWDIPTQIHVNIYKESITNTPCCGMENHGVMTACLALYLSHVWGRHC